MDARRSSPGARIDAVIAAGPAQLLNAAGFRRRGKNFHLVDTESSAHLNFQGSQSNNREQARFTINLGRYFPALAARLAEQVVEDAWRRHFWHAGSRVGHLIAAVQADYWWQLNSTDDVASIGAEVTAALRDYAVPFLQSIATLEGLVADNSPLPQWQRDLPPTAARAEVLSLLGREAEATAIRALVAEQLRLRRERLG